MAKNLPVINEIQEHLNLIGLTSDSYNAHLHKKFMYVTFLCYNHVTHMETTIIAKVNTDNSYKLYAELD